MGPLVLYVMLSATPVPDGVRQQVKWLEATLDDGAVRRSAHDFPNGELFAWEFWGLALLNVAEQTHEAADEERAITQVGRLLPKLDTMLHHFPQSAQANWKLRGGIIWFGGQNLLRARLVALLGARATPQELERLHADTAVLAEAFAESKDGVLETAAGLTWPVDNLFALESLKVHDATFCTSHFPGAWAKHARTLDAVTAKSGLPASFVTLEGKARDVPRGCALSWSLAVMPRLDATRSKRMWAAYQRDFFSCGVLPPCLVREYPPGIERKADIDSGAIVGGYGLAATGFALGAARANGDATVSSRLEATGELFGDATQDARGKRYMGGSIAMFDVLSLYVRTVPGGATLPDRKCQTTTSGGATHAPR